MSAQKWLYVPHQIERNLMMPIRLTPTQRVSQNKTTWNITAATFAAFVQKERSIVFKESHCHPL